MLQGKKFFQNLTDKNMIIMACNTRIVPGVVKGIFRAAKHLNAAVIMELAKSECNPNIGYTGLTPETYGKFVKDIAREVGFDKFVLHADHITIKKDSPEEIQSAKDLIDAQIKAGYTSFAIDASYLFNINAQTVEEQLKRNIEVTTELTNYIKSQYGSDEFGLEVEVGEIGKEDTDGRILTKPEEATTFIKALNNNNIFPQVIAIANGSAHGNTYDKDGNLIEQVSVDIPQTIKVAEALKPFNVKIAQHGITGTPLELIYTKFPHGTIIKGNVGTFWQNLVWDIIKVYKPELYKEMFNWTIENYKDKMPGKKDNEIVGKQGKYATKVFFDKLYSLEPEIIDAIEARAYADALMFFKAFKAKDSAKYLE